MKKVAINGINIFVENKEEYEKLCETFKENVQVDDFEKWETKNKVRYIFILYII